MKILISIMTIVFCYQFLMHAEQSIPVNTQILKEITPSTSYFNGKITPVKTGKFGTLISGKIVYTASPGDMVISQVINAKGDIIRQGTPIIILDNTLPKLAVETARVKLQKDQVKIKNIEQLYNRYVNLNSKKQRLISQTKVEQVKADYDTAILNVKTSEFELKNAEENLSRCTVYPRYTGQVDEVYYSPGTALDDFKDVVKITMMNPMSISLKLPLALINKIGIENEIHVFNVGSKKPVKAILSKDPITPSKVSLIITNELIPSRELTQEQKKLTTVHKALFAVRAYLTDDPINNKNDNDVPLAVPIKSIKKDNKGSYVWKGVGQNLLQNDKAVKTQFKVEKVYINLGDLYRSVSFIKGYGNHFRSVEKTEKISLGDLLLVDAPNSLKDGDVVVYQQLHWRFTVGEKVKITISEVNSKGFYVPFTAIFNVYLGTPQVCLVKNGKAVFVDVIESGLHDEYVRIEGDKLKEGSQVVLDTNNALQNVYNGADLKVINTVNTLGKLSHNVAKQYAPVSGSKDTFQ